MEYEKLEACLAATGCEPDQIELSLAKTLIFRRFPKVAEQRNWDASQIKSFLENVMSLVQPYLAEKFPVPSYFLG